MLVRVCHTGSQAASGSTYIMVPGARAAAPRAAARLWPSRGVVAPGGWDKLKWRSGEVCVRVCVWGGERGGGKRGRDPNRLTYTSMCSLAGLRAVERLEDARFALAHRARVYDASRVLLRSRCPGGAAFADDRRRALSALERHARASFLPTAGRAGRAGPAPPSRVARCFRASRSEWVAVANYICECTLGRSLGRCVGGGVDGRREDGGEGAVTDAVEVVDGLGILTLLFFLHPPSVAWIPMDMCLVSILRAEGSESQSMVRKRGVAQRLRLAMVDSVLAFCVARARSRTFVADYRSDSEASRLPVEPLENALNKAFAALSRRCSYQLNQGAVFGAAQQAKQSANIEASLDALDRLKRAPPHVSS